MKILVVSPHPDDETLGAGGTLLKMKRQGHHIYWLNITDMSVDDGWDLDIIEHRAKQIQAVREFYKFDGFYNLNLSPTRLSDMPEGDIVGAIKKVYEEVRPEWIIIPGNYDAHSDHRVVYNCCMACAKTFRAPYIKRITTMEIISETEYGFQKGKFEPNLFVDITDELEDKITAMKKYDTEIEESPFPRNAENIKSIAIFRGGSCARKYAEAFFVIKQVE